MRIRRNDTVQVMRGKDKGKRGKVQRTIPKDGRMVVEGMNIVKRHVRAGRTVRQAGIVQQEAPLHSSKVLLVCVHCSRPTRVGMRHLSDGSKVRVCQKCHEVIE